MATPFADGDERSAALQEHKNFSKAVDEIRNDRTLSSDGRRIEVAKAWVASMAVLRELRAKYDAAVQAELDSAESQAFGPVGPRPATAEASVARDASYRDALERAEAAEKPDALEALMRRAHRTGDALQEHAAAVTGAGRGWTAIVTAYGELQPDRAEAITSYSTIAADYRRPQLRITNQSHFGLSKPTEIDGRTPAQIQAMADGKLRPSGEPNDR